MRLQKKAKFNLEFKMVLYLCRLISEEKFELIATSLKNAKAGTSL
jgi:hypothetical protein